MIVSIEARKKRRLERLTASVEHIRGELSEYAHRRGGRFILFGSVARGQHRFDSDLDIVVDFPATSEREAWFHAEKICTDHHVRPDIHLASEASKDLMTRVSREGVVLS